MTSPILHAPRDVIVKAGQVILLHNGTKIILKVTATADTRYFTAWQSIVGTMAEVNAKVTELKLS
jgi:hydroxyethylthiazole kinase-like sugar kinase family protein